MPANIATWCATPFLSLDTETTSPDPKEARIVTASALLLSSAGVVESTSWLINPGVEIPAEAAAIHGITTERARAEGVEPGPAIASIADSVRETWANGCPVVIMNARYDLCVLSCEVARHGLPPLGAGPVLDPQVLDRAVDKYRKGKRKLVDLARHYRVREGAAHSSDGDALMAARVLWKLAQHPTIRGLSLAQVQSFQIAAHAEWAANYQLYLREQGNAAAVIDGAWPL